MHGVRRRQVQECIGSCELQQLPGKLELASAEHSFERLHLPNMVHRRLCCRRGRHMHCLCRRKLQEHGRDWKLLLLPDELRLTRN